MSSKEEQTQQRQMGEQTEQVMCHAFWWFGFAEDSKWAAVEQREQESKARDQSSKIKQRLLSRLSWKQEH